MLNTYVQTFLIHPWTKEVFVWLFCALALGFTFIMTVKFINAFKKAFNIDRTDELLLAFIIGGIVHKIFF